MDAISQKGSWRNSILYQNLVTRTDNYAYVTQSDLISTVTEGTTNYSYTYDANGNITSDDRHTYVYNEQNQLYRVMDGQTVLGEYTYNAKGQRVKKAAGSTTTIYHYDLMGNLIQETGTSGNVITSYVYAGNIRIAKVEPNGTIYYYHNDHLGTPLAMTDTSGNIVWKAAYNPFGKAEVDQSSTVTNNFRFPGQYYDSESGLHYNWHRYYDPGTGRYVTSDPIGLNELGEEEYETLNHLYSYVENRPINGIDLTGRITWGDDVIPPNADVITKLKCMEGRLGIDLLVTEGRRPLDADYGAPKSAHKSGIAADLMTNLDACKVKEAAQGCGFVRVCQSQSKGHIHVDLDRTHSSDCKKWSKKKRDGGPYKDPCEKCNK